ncbi:uncharacterized protein LOC124451954 [Xenia sp. Carnegie-2017]|uniref:uncharacterized protein LOC124451954 n=1 Tax=Xenia sp. Carnegie-2017 TaxID=2897299 RepID=UPI001F04EEF7|nr:uncharacterized protein LOC124451954 [Xenia sp. Carnegie-2017]
MASPPKKLKIEANGSRLSKLLINKGTQALKTTLQFIINFRSSNLIDELNKPSNKSTLESLRKRSVINKEQWDLLYPSTGLPNLENFDISLLTVLLRNICGLTAPHGGWDNLPSSSDTSISANIARIKFYRNKVYGHISTTSIDDSTYEYLWDEISKALVGLGIQQTEIDDLKKAPLSPDEVKYIDMLKNFTNINEDVEKLGKCNFNEEFHRLPKWIKIFITSRPELPVQKELKSMNPVEITTHPCDVNNKKDLHKYLIHQLSDRVQRNPFVLFPLVEKCEGSFLYAYYAQLSLKEENIELTYETIRQLVPSGLSGVYTKQFKRVKELLTKESPRNSAVSETTFMQFLELLAACREFLPLTLLLSYLGFSGDIKFEVRSKIIELLSQILPVYDDCLTVYHKSLIDWLKSDGYEQHEFTVNPKNGHKFLWHACEKVFKHIKSMNIFKNQMNTAMIKYALKNGIYHMSKCGENVDFSWAVDVKVVCARLMSVEDIETYTSRSELSEIIKKLQTFLIKDVLEEQLFQMTFLFKAMRSELTTYTIDESFFYLQFNANRIDGNNERRLLARDLLKQGKFVWFEDLDSTYLTNHHHLTVPLLANVTSLCVSSNEELLAVGYENGQISIFELPEFEQRCTLGIALDDSRLGNLNVNRIVSRYDIYDSPSSKEFVRGNICCCSFSPTGNRLVTSDRSTEVKLWDVNNGRLLLCLQSDDVVNRCSFLDSDPVSIITMHYNTGTLALVTNGGCGIKFLKLNVPE